MNRREEIWSAAAATPLWLAAKPPCLLRRVIAVAALAPDIQNAPRTSKSASQPPQSMALSAMSRVRAATAASCAPNVSSWSFCPETRFPAIDRTRWSKSARPAAAKNALTPCACPYSLLPSEAWKRSHAGIAMNVPGTIVGGVARFLFVAIGGAVGFGILGVALNVAFIVLAWPELASGLPHRADGSASRAYDNPTPAVEHSAALRAAVVVMGCLLALFPIAYSALGWRHGLKKALRKNHGGFHFTLRDKLMNTKPGLGPLAVS